MDQRLAREPALASHEHDLLFFGPLNLGGIDHDAFVATLAKTSAIDIVIEEIFGSWTLKRLDQAHLDVIGVKEPTEVGRGL